MLSARRSSGKRRPPRSLHAEYQHFIDQRIEEYKDQLPREDILGIGDEAAQELTRTEQIQLTEMVLSEQVDAIIRRRLKLPSFRRWRENFLTLRAAQIQPGHWGLAAHDPVVMLAELVEEEDAVLVVGASDGACALFLAARGAHVTVIDPDLAAICGLENRAVLESLGGHVECEVAPLPNYVPGRHPFLACVIEAAALVDLGAAERRLLVERLKDATPTAGRHVVMPVTSPAGARHVSADALRTLYADWTVDMAPAANQHNHIGFLATRNGASV